MERMGKMINRLAVLNKIDSHYRLKEYGLTGNEGTVLMILKHHQNVYQDFIVKALQIDKSAVTRLLHKMEKKGLIERIQSKEDKRCYMIQMTSHGADMQILVDRIFEQKDRDTVKGLSFEEEKELRRMLAIVKENLKGGERNG